MYQPQSVAISDVRGVTTCGLGYEGETVFKKLILILGGLTFVTGADAHFISGALRAPASATNRWKTTCAVGTAKLAYTLKKRSAVVPKVTVSKGRLSQVTPAGESGELVAGKGTYLLVVSKEAAIKGTALYELDTHCEDNAGNHTRQTEPRRQ